MWGRAMGGARLLPLLLLLLPGSMGLQCLSCDEDDGGGCRGATNVTCPTESEVCSEALAAVTWSHGRFALGARGCGRGQPGALARALELLGLVVFERRRNCAGTDGCNRDLPLGESAALPLPANGSARAPNGLRCYGCPEAGPCSPATVVHCYGDLRGCFRGALTLRAAGRTLRRELRGCVRDPACGRQARGDHDAALSGSCCAGDLCNGRPDHGDGAFFEPDLPRLELLPHGHAVTAAPGNASDAGNATAGGVGAEAAGGDVGEAGGDATTAAPRRETPAGDKRAAGGKMEAGDKMAAGDNMAAGHVAPRRPMGRKDATKGVAGRGQALGGPGWLLPFLLLPLLR